jgi:hypothetical protein
MTTMTRIPSMGGVNAKLAELKATTDKMTLDERKALLESLTESIRVDAAAVDAPKRRLAKVQAAATDPKKTQQFKDAVIGLRRLGMEIEQIAASGSIADLDHAMAERKWTPLQRFALKGNLAAVGAIEN